MQPIAVYDTSVTPKKLSRYSYSPTCYLSRAFPMKSLYGVVCFARKLQNDERTNIGR